METVKIAEAKEFDEFVYGHPKGHMMQTSAWGKVKKEWDWTGFIVRDDEGKIKGACAVLIREIIPSLKMMYAPRGPVCDLDDEETVKALLTAVAEYGKKNKAYTFKIDTDTLATNEKYINLLKSLGFKFKEEGSSDFDTVQAHCIFRLDVGGKTEDEVMAGFHSKTRYNTRLAERKGIRIEIKGKEACEDFHSLMLLTGARDGFAIRGTEYFERIMDAFGDDARIYFAYYEDELLAGALNVHVGDKIWYVYGASSNSHRNLMPTYLVQWSMIKWAIEEGCNWYDFRGGYPDENNPLHGIYKFKAGFCPNYMDFMGEADLILNKTGYKLVNTAIKARKTLRKIKK